MSSSSEASSKALHERGTYDGSVRSADTQPTGSEDVELAYEQLYGRVDAAASGVGVAAERSDAGVGDGPSGFGDGDASGKGPGSGRSDAGDGGKRKKRWDAKGKALLVVGIVLVAVALGILGYIGKGYIDARMEYDEVRETAGVDTEQLDEALADVASDDGSGLEGLDIDWDALKAINPNICGWIYVQGTSIDYPIVQAGDNDYYLHHSFYGTVSSSGAIFLDCENSSDFSDMHNIIYGHHMRDGSMFKQIVRFKEQSYLDEFVANGYEILILTPDTAYILQPAYTYICSNSDSEELLQFGFSSAGELQEYMSERMDDAVSETSFDLGGTEKLFSLVTCSYEADNVRTVLCCVPTDVVTFANGS